MKKVLLFLILVTIVQVSLAAGTIGGQTTGSEVIPIPNPLKVTSFVALLNKIIDFLILIGGSVLTLMIIWGAFQMLTASGDVEKVTTGRKTITYAVVGYAIIFISKAIVVIIQKVLE